MFFADEPGPGWLDIGGNATDGPRTSVAVEAITTDRPGYIIFEDDNQIAAEPFADTPT